MFTDFISECNAHSLGLGSYLNTAKAVPLDIPVDDTPRAAQVVVGVTA